MLRDDAIRQGRLMPTEEDIKRMNLTDKELNEIRSKLGKGKISKPKVK